MLDGAFMFANYGVVTGSGSSGSWSISSTAATEESNGNYRYSFQVTTDATSTLKVGLSVLNSSNEQNYLGDGTSGILLWGADVKEGTVLSSYIRNP